MHTLSTFHAALLLLATVCHVLPSLALSLDENNNHEDRNEDFLWPVDNDLAPPPPSLHQEHEQRKVSGRSVLSQCLVDAT